MTEQEWKLTREVLTLKRQLVVSEIERLNAIGALLDRQIAEHGEAPKEDANG